MLQKEIDPCICCVAFQCLSCKRCFCPVEPSQSVDHGRGHLRVCAGIVGTTVNGPSGVGVDEGLKEGAPAALTWGSVAMWKERRSCVFRGVAWQEAWKGAGAGSTGSWRSGPPFLMETWGVESCVFGNRSDPRGTVVPRGTAGTKLPECKAWLGWPHS